MTQNLNHYEKILSRSHSNYLAQISIEMTEANNQINNVLSKLTALGTVLIPMNLVTGEYLISWLPSRILAYFCTGLWGMNVHVPGQDVTEVSLFYLSQDDLTLYYGCRVTPGSSLSSAVSQLLLLLAVTRPINWFASDRYLLLTMLSARHLRHPGSFLRTVISIFSFALRFMYRFDVKSIQVASTPN